MNKRIYRRKILNALTLLLICALYICDLIPFGSLIIAGIAILILIINTIMSGGKIRIKWSALFGYIITFASYCGLSSLWAHDPSYSVQQCITIIELAICAYILYICYVQDQSVLTLWKILMYSGVIVSVYTIITVGVSGIMRGLISGTRLELGYTNINSVALLDTYAILIAVYYMVFHRTKKYLWFVPLYILIVLASQTRKAFIALVVGIVILVYFKSKAASIPKKIMIAALSVVGLYFAYNIISSIEVFEPILIKFERAFNAFMGEGYVDNSTRQRAEMNRIGYEQFLNNPLLGMGIGNPRILLKGMWGTNYPYLHNNYIELLAGGGLIGTILYYVMYIYVLVKTFIYRKAKYPPKYVIWVVCANALLLDYFMVTYYSKITYIFFVFLYIGVKEMEKCSKGETKDYLCK